MTIKTDTFTEASDTPLENHSSDVGNGWSGADTANFDIVATDDEVKCGTGANNHALGNENPSNADQWCEVRGKSVGTGGLDRIGAIVRANADPDAYRLWIQGNGYWNLDKVVNGSVTNLDWGSISGFSASTFYDVKVQIEGSTLKGFINSSEVSSQTDTAITAAGNIGLMMGEASARITSLDSDTVATVVNLAGTSSGISSLTGSTKVTRELLGAASGVALVDGSLKPVRDFTGSISALSALDGVLKPTRGIAGISEGVSAATGAAGAERSLSGLINASSGLDSTLKVLRQILSSLNATSSVTGTLGTAEILLIGAVNALTGVDGLLKPTRGLAGSSLSTTGLNGILKMSMALSGMAEGLSGTNGSVTMIGEVILNDFIQRIDQGMPVPKVAGRGNDKTKLLNSDVKQKAVKR